MRGRWLWLNLCWLWIVLLIVYLIWGGITQTGLYYWVGTLEVDNFGHYDPELTGFAPGLLLGLPALWPLAVEARRQRRAPPDPAASARTMRRAGFVMGGLGLAAWVGAVTCFLAARALPAGGGSMMPFDAAALGNGPPPAGEVRLAGTLDRNARASFVAGGKGESWVVTYTGFHAAGEAAEGGPLRIFVEHHIRNRSGWNVPYIGNDESGFLVENGLPPLIRYALDREGVRIATPHYLLRTGGGILREPYYVGAGLGVFFGSLLLAGGALLMFLPGRRLRAGAS